MGNVLFIIGLVIAFILVAIVLPQLLLLRTVPKVVRIFRERNAVGEKNAKTIDELGLKPKSMLERMFRMRDYRPRSLDFLLRVTIVGMTDEGKVYLDENKLLQTRWSNL